MNISKISTPLCMVGEGPVWDVAEQALYWCDIAGRSLHRWQAGSGLCERWATIINKSRRGRTRGIPFGSR